MYTCRPNVILPAMQIGHDTIMRRFGHITDSDGTEITAAQSLQLSTFDPIRNGNVHLAGQEPPGCGVLRRTTAFWPPRGLAECLS